MRPAISHTQRTDILEHSKRIAVVGASPNPSRPSHWISEFLMSKGYEVIPVNPGHDTLFGLTCYPDVAKIPGDVHVINVFRRSDTVLPIVEAAVNRPEVKLIWMQDGVYNEEAAELAARHNIPLVMNDCIYRFLMQVNSI
ncbi:MAG: CoA-binding protein [Candidatus Marinimicrobia bacterium]|nr:CoA-binding protein [Candidatus Neomarinimicrobiota bacterium]MCF7850477.1 CoA-binding protein [Candidatus Neomarinimicrobiota bacterium]